MATPNIVPRADKEGSLGTSAKAWGGLNVESTSTKGSSAAKIENNDADQAALEIQATANTTNAALYVAAPALTTGSAALFDINDALTTSHTNRLLYIDYDKSGVTASGQTASIAGINVSLDDAATNHASGAVAMTGATISVGSDNAQGTITQTGLSLSIAASGAADLATTFGIDSVVADGAPDIRMKSSASQADYATIGTTANGATTIATVDGSAMDAHLTLDVDGDVIVDADSGNVYFKDDGTTLATVASLRQESFMIACSDETTLLTTGTAKATFRMPYAFTLTGVRASVTTAPTGSVLTVDINEAGATILTTKLTIDASEKTSTSAATAAVIGGAGPALADDAEITIDIDGVGSTVAGKGLKITLIGYQTV